MPLAVGDQVDSSDGVTFEVTGFLHAGQNTLYAATCDTTPHKYVIKVGETATDETLTLAGLYRDADPKFLPYLPQYTATLLLDGDMANVFRRLDGFYNLNDVMAHYPNGLDPKDVAWIFRRLLVPLGFAHKRGYIHGAVLPQHVMLLPEHHGLVLVDWTHAGVFVDWTHAGVFLGTDQEPMPITPVDDHEDWYPSEALTPRAGSHTDIFMAANLMVWLLGGDPVHHALPAGIPREFRPFFMSCLKVDYKQRQSEAWKVMGNFDVLIEHLWGKRKFHPFHIPPQQQP